MRRVSTDKRGRVLRSPRRRTLTSPWCSKIQFRVCGRQTAPYSRELERDIVLTQPHASGVDEILQLKEGGRGTMVVIGNDLLGGNDRRWWSTVGCGRNSGWCRVGGGRCWDVR
jgi:hypothetical protein